jgi:integrase
MDQQPVLFPYWNDVFARSALSLAIRSTYCREILSRETSIDAGSGMRRHHHVADGALQKLVLCAARKAGLNLRVSPHMLRHTHSTSSWPAGWTSREPSLL